MPTAVCIGATSGIGSAAASELARHGYTVWILGRDKVKGNELVKSIAASGSGKAEFLQCDVATLKGMRSACTALEERVQVIDVLIQTQGVLTLENLHTEDGLALVTAVQVLSRYYCTKLLLPLLKKSTAPRMIFVAAGMKLTDRVTFAGEKGFPTYMPKWTGWQGMGEAQISIFHVARHYAKTEPWLKVACVNAGLVNTGILRDMPPIMGTLFPLCCCCMIITAEKAASNVVFLAMNEASWVSGMYWPKPGNAEVKVMLDKLNEADNKMVIEALVKVTGG